MKTSNTKVTEGCYIDGANARTEHEIALTLISLLKNWNPNHNILKIWDDETIKAESEFIYELIDELTEAINESIDESQVAIWDSGDLLIRKLPSLDDLDF